MGAKSLGEVPRKRCDLPWLGKAAWDWAWERNGETLLLEGGGLELKLLAEVVLTAVWSELGIWPARGNKEIWLEEVRWQRTGRLPIQDPKLSCEPCFLASLTLCSKRPPLLRLFLLLSPSVFRSQRPLYSTFESGLLHGPSSSFSDSLLSLDESRGFRTI